MMQILQQKGFVEPLKAYLRSDRPFLGIAWGSRPCLKGARRRPRQGAGLLPARSRGSPSAFPVPHMGWNGLNIKQPSVIFNGLRGDEKFYFVHSYHVSGG